MGTKANPIKGRIQSYVCQKIKDLEHEKEVWITLGNIRAKIHKEYKGYIYPECWLVSYDGCYDLVEIIDKDLGSFTSLIENNPLARQRKHRGTIWKAMSSFKFHAEISQYHEVKND